jgi:hypothetical protein|mmetsp:Transcript_72088/g.120936  ORF Transcript_72088/g.120936 Transcript_72088/m.120936 type:complete len:279 (-) Transcript_72088:1554-2390(-)|eukprot:CAMPEP_0174288984 /NCGR_PEP_ID=MMETSP0809-20121228/23111_1 /TAXON_ID=73025 ORGANISM="Eutreptiella gymnastica-like, Strain CCMP1594" /NCGR_SAMPLE_ID=MMETSP0809 /ASSEMBLY_ACC=CAM_ASM_000658 /LENGTH=278 /DNA_ID=CAMNT_0015386619 /DNA_START=147 /DNA_END=983 /DNA_ORIENTATION=+
MASPSASGEFRGPASDAGSSLEDRGDTMQGAPSRSLNAKRLRMVAENDVQFLANRIAKLKAEEFKAKKEVDKTVTKTKEILANRKNFEHRAVDKLQIQEQVANSKKEERLLMSLNKDKQLKAIWVAKQKVLNEKKEACTSMRKQKEINECRVHIMKEEQRDKNIKRREDIKKEHVYAKMRREKEQNEKLEHARLVYEERIAQEEAERERKEKLAAQLVQQEAQLIYRLKRLHTEKQKAIRDLANAVDVVKADEVEEDIEGDEDEEQHEAAEIVEEETV